MKIKESRKKTNESLVVTVLEEESGLFINAAFRKNQTCVEEIDGEDVDIYTLEGGTGGGPAQITDHNVITMIAGVVQSYECRQLMNKLPESKMADLNFEPIFKLMTDIIKESQLIFNSEGIKA